MTTTTTTTTALTKYIVAIRHTPGLPESRHYQVLATDPDAAVAIGIRAAGTEGVGPATDTSLMPNVTVLSGDVAPGSRARADQVLRQLTHRGDPDWSLQVYRTAIGWRAGHTDKDGPYAVVDSCVDGNNRRRIWGRYNTYDAASRAATGTQYVVVRASGLPEGRNWAWGDARLIMCFRDGTVAMTS